MDDESIRKWPIWLRWAIAYPAALIGSILIAWIVRVLQSLTNVESDNKWWFDVMQNGVIGVLFVYISAWFAPRYKQTVSIISLAIVIAFVFFLIGLVYLAGRYGNNIDDPITFYISSAVFIAGAVVGVIMIHGDKSEN